LKIVDEYVDQASAGERRAGCSNLSRQIWKRRPPDGYNVHFDAFFVEADPPDPTHSG